MRPHVGWERRDIEIADHDHAALAVAPHGLEPGGERLEEVELVAEAVVERGVGGVAAGGRIDIMQDDRICARAFNREGAMARVSAPATGAARGKREGVAPR